MSALSPSLSPRALGCLVCAVFSFGLTACDDGDGPPPISTPLPTPDMDGEMIVDMPMDALDMGASEPDQGVDMTVSGEDMGVDMKPCVPVSDADLCQMYSSECEELADVVDNCGQMRSVANCGVCMRPQLCDRVTDADEALVSSACSCLEDDPARICSEVGRLCGALAAPCDQVVCDSFCVDQVAAGGAFNCALGSANMRCWGGNSSGQLGLGDRSRRDNPTPYNSPDLDEIEILQIETGAEHSCAIIDGANVPHALICWGDNERGQLGTGTDNDAFEPDLADPGARAIAGGVAKVTLGREHTCALVDDDYSSGEPQPPYSAYCWGTNEFGSLGNPERVAINEKAAVTNIRPLGLRDNVYDIATGYRHTCAIVDAEDPSDPDLRKVVCWGKAEYGQLGNLQVAVTRPASFGCALPQMGACTRGRDMQADNAAGEGCKIVVSNTGNEGCEFDPDQFCADNQSTCDGVDGCRLDGQGNCVIDPEDFFQFGNVGGATSVRSGENYFEPRPVEVLASINGKRMPNDLIFGTTNEEVFTGKFVELATGRTFSCVRDDQGQVYCWGLFHFDYQGDTCEQDFLRAVPVGCNSWPVSGYEEEADEFIYPIVSQTEDAFERKWGDLYRQRFTGAIPSGKLIARASALRPVVMRYHHLDDGLLPSTEFEADGSPLLNRPVQASQITGFYEHMCMLVEEPDMDKTNVYCIGHNDFGEVGDGTTSPASRPLPLVADVDGNTVRASQVSVGDRHSCVVVDDSNIKCWGSNANSQIGNENLDRDSSLSPFDVLLR